MAKIAALVASAGSDKTRGAAVRASSAAVKAERHVKAAAAWTAVAKQGGAGAKEAIAKAAAHVEHANRHSEVALGKGGGGGDQPRDEQGRFSH